MREVKFRAWVKELGILANVVAIDFENEKVVLPIETESTYWWHTSTFDLKDVVLMQYTGLKDINGIEIYEGDIYQYNMTVALLENDELCEMSVKKHAIVEFKDGAFMTDYYALYDALENDDNPLIVGNIYENPELLVNEGGA